MRKLGGRAVLRDDRHRRFSDFARGNHPPDGEYSQYQRCADGDGARPRRCGLFSTAIDEQTVARPRDALDGERAGRGLRGDAPGHRDRAIEAVLADVHTAPALVVQPFAGNDLTIRVGKQEEDLHDQRFDVSFACRTSDQTQSGADPEGTKLKILARRQICKPQHGLPPSSSV